MGKRRTTSAPLHPRAAAMFALVPLTAAAAFGCLFLPDLLSLGDGWDARRWYQLALPGFMPIFVFYFGALALWASTVRWNEGRRLLAIGVSLVLITLYWVIALAVDLGDGPDEQNVVGFILWLAAALAGPAVALTALAHALRDPVDAAGSSRFVPCPACNANLALLRAAECPQCGRRWTLEALARSQRVAEALGLGESVGASSPDAACSSHRASPPIVAEHPHDRT
jgi:hypothetical protein